MSNDTTINTTEAPALTLEYILSRIDQILADTAYLHEALDVLAKMPPAAGPGDVAGAERAQAIATSVKCRETTNQQVILLLEKMYEDLRPAKPEGDILKLQQLSDALCRMPQDYAQQVLAKAAQQLFVKPGAEIVK